jgi:hypothetical protein
MAIEQILDLYAQILLMKTIKSPSPLYYCKIIVFRELKAKNALPAVA